MSLTAAGTFQYATMTGIALAGLLLGSLADRFGRRRTIVIGLTLFAAACFLLAAGNTFLFFAVLLGLSGLAIGVFKTGALALIGDISTSTAEHTSIMNTAEGFFGVGAIVGPAILARLLAAGLSWKWLYVIAGAMCVVLIVLALAGEVSRTTHATGALRRRRAEPARDEESLRAGVLGRRVSLRRRRGGDLRVDADAARGLHRHAPRARHVQHLDLLPAARRRTLSRRVDADAAAVAAVLAMFSGCILACFALSVAGGVDWAVFLLPLSGLFMSVIYPTINSKGISCVPKAEHGAAAGVILFFTCVSAVLAPLAMGAVSDAFGHIIYGFWLATGFAAVLFAGLLLNWLTESDARGARTARSGRIQAGTLDVRPRA